ncbi:MAG: PAS domain S-box protein, partial [Methanoregula sp.]|nr:PAS domain S-box protein [Methanoregula sp.]
MISGTGIKVTHILFIEDDKAQQDLVLRAFRNDPEKFRVSVAGNLREARQILERDLPDLILSDWILPDGKGLDILVRTDGAVTIPLIIMTGYGDEQLAVEIMKSGAIDYVVKSATVFHDLPHITRRALRDWENIHERKRAEEAVRDSEKRLADIISFLPDAVLAIDNEGRVIAWNNAMEQMTGVAAEEMLGKGDHEYSIPFYGERRPILIDLVLMDDTEIEKKYDYILRDSERITSETFIPTLLGGIGVYLWGTASPLYDSAGNRIGAIEVIRDITERKRVDKECQAKEYQLSTIYRNISEVLFFLSVEQNNRYRFLSVNQPFLDVTGLTQEQVVGNYVHEVIPEPSLTLILEKYKQAIQDNTTVTWEEITGYPGGKKYGEVSVTPLIDATGRCTNLVGSVHDITEHKRMEDLLIRQNATLETLLNAPVDVLMLLDRQGIIIRINEEGARRSGGTVQTVTGQSVYDLLPPDIATARKTNIDRVLESGEPVRFDDERYGKYLNNAIYPVFNPDHTAVEYVAVFVTDITERKKAELALRESETRLSLALDVGNAGIWEWNLERNDVCLNDRFHAMLGYTPGELPTSLPEWLSYHHPEDIPVWMSKAEAYLRGDTPIYESEHRIRTKAGTWAWVFTRGQIAPSTIAGSAKMFVGIAMIVTGRRLTEEKLRESEEQLLMAQEIGHIGGWEYDLQTKEIWGSAEGARIYGFPPVSGDFPIDQIEACIPERELVHQALVDLIHEEKEYNLEFAINPADGSPQKVILSIARLEKDAQGIPIKVVGVIQDITNRKQAEEKLCESETRFRTMVEQSPFSIQVMSPDGRTLQVNKAFEELWGLVLPDLKDYNILQDDELVQLGLMPYIQAGFSGETVSVPPAQYDVYHMFGKGGKKWVQSRIYPIRDTSGSIRNVILMHEDISERSQAEEALRQNQVRLATAMDIANLVNWEYDFATGMFTFDDRFYALYETTAEREGGNLMSAETYMQEFVYPEDRPAVLASIQKIFATTDPAYTGQVEHRITPRDGSVRTVIARFVPIMDPDGKVIRTYGANQDITDRMLMESEIRSLNTVLEERVKDRTKALSKANEALELENAHRIMAEEKLQASYDEKVMLLKEIHHRVKNNLQIIASLLNLQSRYITDEKTLAAIRESQNRVKAMALVHEKLYRAEDISHISLQDYIRFLGTGLFQFYDAKIRGIQFTLDVHDIDVDIDAAIPLGLIIN